ncbi:tape measure protein [Aquabacterium sp. OR-4]|uniref:tape measure protein n=1 Tax=Aquabacterium sp. OR-4 TaxID=2978127 RepID=UPI0021B42204|nr:tape measure protein [Aquabacterium sp. OR-4]MDT7834955.1 tape measure protein [Aquabacterium sp. OR-4]
MSEKVGGVHYDVTLETKGLINGEREAAKSLDRVGGLAEGLGARLTATAAAAAVLGSALAAMKIAQRADEFRLLGARVEVAAGGVEAGAAAMRELEAISKRTMTSVAGNAEVFSRLNQSILQMGGTQADTLQVTELLGKAIKVSGASAVESKAAMLQFGQALGSGKLAGDELRSLMETAPYLMRQLADGIGVPVGALKKLGEEGKLTSDVVVSALGKAATKIEADFARFPPTFEAAFTALEDAALRANERLDTLTGTSAALTGATKGLADGVDLLAQYLAEVTTEGDKLGRSGTVKTWAEAATEAFTYLVDGAHAVVKGFRMMGITIGGVAAATAAATRGEFAQAWEIMRQVDADFEKIGSSQGAGQRMRELMALRKAEDRGFTPAAAMSKLKPAAGADGDAKKTGAKFDGTGYLATLERATLDGHARIDAAEREALRKNDALLQQKKLSLAEHMQAEKLIREEAAQDRQTQSQRELDQMVERINAQGAIEEQERKRKEAAEAQRQQGRDFALGVTAEGDPIARLMLEQERKKALLAQFAMEDQANMQLYADAKVALEKDTERKITAIREEEEEKRRAAQAAQLQGYGNMFGSMADLAKTFGGEQSKTYKAMFAVSKAFAIADSIIKIQQGIAAAAALPFPTNIPAMATVAAQTAGIVSTIRGQQFGGGRQYGGPVSAGSLYKVNETGRPEMFTGSNGSQYMLPTRSGSVTPADEVGGGGGGWTIIINNAPAGTTATVDNEARVIEVAVARAKSEIASEIGQNTGPVWGALRAGANVQSRL